MVIDEDLRRFFLSDLRHRAAVGAAERTDEEAPEAPPEELEKPRAVRVEEGEFGIRFSPDGSRLAFQVHSYDNNSEGRVITNAPWTLYEYWDMTRRVDLKDYVVE